MKAMGGAGALMTGQRASSEDKGYFTMADVAQRRAVETNISSRVEHFIKTLSTLCKIVKAKDSRDLLSYLELSATRC